MTPQSIVAHVYLVRATVKLTCMKFASNLACYHVSRPHGKMQRAVSDNSGASQTHQRQKQIMYVRHRLRLFFTKFSRQCHPPLITLIASLPPGANDGDGGGMESPRRNITSATHTKSQRHWRRTYEVPPASTQRSLSANQQ